MKKLASFLIMFILLIIALHWGNTTITVTQYTVEVEGLPGAFEGTNIVQLSDLHDAQFGESQSTLIQKVKDLEPDFIFITGDLVDSNRYNLDQSLDAVKGLIDVAPIFYVTGNHEIATRKAPEIKERLSQLGVIVLSNETFVVKKEGESLEILGIEDPLDGVTVKRALESHPASETVRLTLSHRPEVFQDYVVAGESVVFTGHAHGGQVRIPFVGGIVAPGQGFFPDYTAGIYQQGNTHMVVSRGLGNSLIPLRVGNRPEIVEVTLQ